MTDYEVSLGAIHLGGGRCRFRLWAPLASEAAVHVVSGKARLLPMAKEGDGYHVLEAEDISPGDLYYYRLDGGRDLPDPASRHQPQGVHGPSEVVASGFPWEDGAWTGLALEEHVLYELHAGCFTPEGTLEAVIPHLDGLKRLGVTAIELMPVAQFPGSRNWGYDGVFPFAVQCTYGGPAALRKLVNACHRRGLAVCLDVVYNHLGPEGNHLAEYAPYFTDRYPTPWGRALNFDGPRSDEVRRYFIENALHWIADFHIDALRLDAVHAIYDFSASPFLAELAASVRRLAERLKRRVHLIAESDLNDARLVLPAAAGGHGLDAQWSDDFHHALHALLTGEQDGYYEDYGSLADLARAMSLGYVYTGQYSKHRRRRHGNSPRLVPAWRFVVSAQNHDQVGNRLLGERLSSLVTFEQLKLAAGAVLCSPFLPLLFMGEEYGETAPFQYFVNHLDPELAEAVRQGRRKEFERFRWEGEPPDPNDETTFLRSKLDHGLRRGGKHRVLEEYYSELLRLRRELPALAVLSKDDLEVQVQAEEKVLVLWRRQPGSEAVAAFNFDGERQAAVLRLAAGDWRKLLDSAEERWLGPGSAIPRAFASPGSLELVLPPYACVLFAREEREGEA
jgi:maltooligosyltrehalose trehalohydrolase